MGAAMGLFFSAMGGADSTGIPLVGPKGEEVPQPRFREQISRSRVDCGGGDPETSARIHFPAP